MRDNSLTTARQEPWPRFSGWPPARSRASPASTIPAPPADHFTTVYTDPADLRKLLVAEPAPNCAPQTATELCDTLIKLSTSLSLNEYFLDHASQVGKQAVALPLV
jgi:hypothetical protein